jgi:hypothetical protein
MLEIDGRKAIQTNSRQILRGINCLEGVGRGEGGITSVFLMLGPKGAVHLSGSRIRLVGGSRGEQPAKALGYGLSLCLNLSLEVDRLVWWRACAFPRETFEEGPVPCRIDSMAAGFHFILPELTFVFLDLLVDLVGSAGFWARILSHSDMRIFAELGSPLMKSFL